MPIHASNLFFQAFQNSAGNSVEMNVNGSVTPQEFSVTVPAGQTLVANRINLHILDGGMRASFFGGLATLTNGVNIKIVDEEGNTDKDFTTNFGNIKQNSDFFMLAGVDGVIEASLGDDVLPVRWTISKAGRSVNLKGGSKVIITVNDDLTGLSRFRAMLQGWLK